MSTKRVYHPTADNFHDVPASAVSTWVDMGWTTDKPKHVTNEDRAPGAFFVAEPVREPEPVAPAPESVAAVEPPTAGPEAKPAKG